MKRLLLFALLSVLSTIPARADLVLFDNGVGFGGCTTANCMSYTDLEGQGFGDHPRLLTLQDNTYEQGMAQPNGSGGVAYPTFPNPGAPGLTGANGAIQTGTDKASAPSLQGLGWTTAAQVGIGFDSDQTGNSGITLQSLALNLYQQAVGQAAVTLIGTFPLSGAINFTQAELALQPGNGNDAFTFVLDATEQAAWNTLITGVSLGQLFIGLSASAGCAGTVSPTCQVSNDGPESFIAIAQKGSPLFVPLPGAIWLFASGLAGLVTLSRRKRKSLTQ